MDDNRPSEGEKMNGSSREGQWSKRLAAFWILQDKEECGNSLHNYIDTKAAGLSFLPIHIKSHKMLKFKETRWDVKAFFVFIIKKGSTKTQIVTALFLSHTFSHQRFFIIWEHHTTINCQWETTQQTGSAEWFSTQQSTCR